MQEAVAHQAMRDELVLWLSDAISYDNGTNGLCAFLKDDFPYDAEHVVGLVLRQDEFQPWETLMAAVENVSIPVSEERMESVRERASALLTAMRS